MIPKWQINVNKVITLTLFIIFFNRANRPAADALGDVNKKLINFQIDKVFLGSGACYGRHLPRNTCRYGNVGSYNKYKEKMSRRLMMHMGVSTRGILRVA